MAIEGRDSGRRRPVGLARGGLLFFLDPLLVVGELFLWLLVGGGQGRRGWGLGARRRCEGLEGRRWRGHVSRELLGPDQLLGLGCDVAATSDHRGGCELRRPESLSRGDAVEVGLEALDVGVALLLVGRQEPEQDLLEGLGDRRIDGPGAVGAGRAIGRRRAAGGGREDRAQAVEVVAGVESALGGAHDQGGRGVEEEPQASSGPAPVGRAVEERARDAEVREVGPLVEDRDRQRRKSAVDDAQAVHDAQGPGQALGQGQEGPLFEGPAFDHGAEGRQVEVEGRGVEPAEVFVRLVDLEDRFGAGLHQR